MSKVYFVREPRCGGTHFVTKIIALYGNAHRGRKIPYVDTHDMNIVKSLTKDQNNIIIRCDRRNLVEHFCSLKFLEYTHNFTNIRFYETIDDHPSLQFGLEQKIIVTERNVQDYIGARLKIHTRFLKDTENLNSTTIYYEDWYKKFDLPDLGLYNIDLCNGMQYTKKLPDYKRTVFVNYDEVVHWIEKYKNDYTKKYNVEKLFEHWECNPSS